jgi:hypothetical protein
LPVNIYKLPAADSEPIETIAWLCDGIWHLPEQIDALSSWVEEQSLNLPVGEYVADVGFHPRDGASGGGPTLEPKTMRRMADLGMSLYFSEYSGPSSA